MKVQSVVTVPSSHEDPACSGDRISDVKKLYGVSTLEDLVSIVDTDQ